MKLAFALSILAHFLLLSGPATASLVQDESVRGLTCDDSCCGVADGTSCDPGDKCVKDATCQSGWCKGRTKVCNAPTQCKNVIGGCHPDTGFCTFENKPNGTPCDDGSDATKYDVCIDGFCEQKPCTGPCCGKADGTPCKTGDKCLKDAKCKSEVCEGRIKICTAPTQCKNVVGACNPSTGFCTFENKPDGTPCDDGKDSTSYDECEGGFCVGY